MNEIPHTDDSGASPDDANAEKLLLPKEAAAALCISPSHLRNLVQQGIITASHHTPGGQRRFTLKDIERGCAALSRERGAKGQDAFPAHVESAEVLAPHTASAESASEELIDKPYTEEEIQDVQHMGVIWGSFALFITWFLASRVQDSLQEVGARSLANEVALSIKHFLEIPVGMMATLGGILLLMALIREAASLSSPGWRNFLVAMLVGLPTIAALMMGLFIPYMDMVIHTADEVVRQDEPRNGKSDPASSSWTLLGLLIIPIWLTWSMRRSGRPDDEQELSQSSAS